MRAFSCIFIFMVTVSVCSAQKIRFTDTSNHWFTQGKDPLDTIFQGDYYYEPLFDRFFDGQKYLALFSGLASHTGGTSYIFHVREDTSAGIVYLWSRTESKEVVLFNYNLHAGDTIHFYNYANPPFIDSVLTVDSVLIRGVYHKVFSMYELEPFYLVDNRYYTYVEGIGSINQPLEQRFFEHFGYRELLTCFISNDSAYSITIPFKDSFFTKSITFANNCSVVKVGADVMLPEMKVLASPNPINDNTQLTFSRLVISGIATITNSIGQEIMNQPFSNRRFIVVGDKIKVPGVYYYKVYDRDGGDIHSGVLLK